MDTTLFGKRLHDTRIMRGMQQKELAKKCFMSVSGLQNVEYGQNLTTFDKAYDLAKALDVDPAWLVGWKD